MPDRYVYPPYPERQRPKPDDEPEPCCPEFANALKSFTDNEGYGPLIAWERGAWEIGAGFPVRFCPWCGKKAGGGKGAPGAP